jgi:hypothetical protein
MKISVTRSGGFAGMTRRGEVDISGRADAKEWHDLVRRADLPNRRDSPGRPDQYTYRIDVDGEVAHVGEADLDEPTRRLVDRVLETGA